MKDILCCLSISARRGSVRFQNEKLFWAGAAASALSIALTIISAALSFSSRNQIEADKVQLLSEIQDLRLEKTTINRVEANIDDDILAARQKIARASARVRGLKAQISIHVVNASRAAREREQAQRSLDEALGLLRDIASNAEKVSIAQDELEDEFLRVVSLYNKKIEDLHRSYADLNSNEKASEPLYTVIFAIIAALGAISAMIVAWRKDHREVIELRQRLVAPHQDQESGA